MIYMCGWTDPEATLMFYNKIISGYLICSYNLRIP